MRKSLMFFKGFIASVRHLLHVRSDASKLNIDVTQIDKVVYYHISSNLIVQSPYYLCLK